MTTRTLPCAMPFHRMHFNPPTPAQTAFHQPICFIRSLIHLFGAMSIMPALSGLSIAHCCSMLFDLPPCSQAPLSPCLGHIHSLKCARPAQPTFLPAVTRHPHSSLNQSQKQVVNTSPSSQRPWASHFPYLTSPHTKNLPGGQVQNQAASRAQLLQVPDSPVPPPRPPTPITRVTPRPQMFHDTLTFSIQNSASMAVMAAACGQMDAQGAAATFRVRARPAPQPTSSVTPCGRCGSGHTHSA